MRKSSAAAKSVHITVTVITKIKSGTRIAGAVTKMPPRVDFDVGGDLTGSSSWLTTKSEDAATEILRVGGQTYLKGDRAYWLKHGTAAHATLVAGKYTRVSAGSVMGKSNNPVREMLDQFYLGMTGKMDPKVQETKVDGVPAYRITTKTGAESAKIYVSADGHARLLRREESTTVQRVTWNFAQWDAVPPVSAPPADQLAKTPLS